MKMASEADLRRMREEYDAVIDPSDGEVTEELRSRALGGESALRHPIVADVTGCWNREFSDAREASMWEAESALAAMLAGADIIFVRGPGAADMARVYGEELADL